MAEQERPNHWKKGKAKIANAFALAALSSVRNDAKAKTEEAWVKFKDRLQRVPRLEDTLLKGSWQTIARMTWDMCVEDRKRLQNRLDEINLNTMKEVLALKTQLEACEAAQRAKQIIPIDEHVEHCEPLRYLSDEVRELVILIIRDKLREISVGNLPESLARAMKGDTSEEQWIERCEELQAEQSRLQKDAADLQAQLRWLTEDLKKSKAQELKQINAAKSAERKLELLLQTSGDAMKMESMMKEIEQERLEAEQERATFRESSTMLLEELRTTQGEIRTLKLQLSSQQAQLNYARVITEKLMVAETELSQADVRLKEAGAEIERVKQEQEHQVQQLQQELYQSSQRSRRTSTMRSNFDLSGLRTPRMSAAVEIPILQPPSPMFKGRNCFDRLYQDATAREDRLHSLRCERDQQKRAEEQMGAIACRQAMDDSARIFESLMEEETARWHERRIVQLPNAWGQSRSTTPSGLRGSAELSMASTTARPVSTPHSPSPVSPRSTSRCETPVSPRSTSRCEAAVSPRSQFFTR